MQVFAAHWYRVTDVGWDGCGSELMFLFKLIIKFTIETIEIITNAKI